MEEGPFHIWLMGNIESKIQLTEKWEKRKQSIEIITQLNSYLMFVSDRFVLINSNSTDQRFKSFEHFWYYYSQSDILLFRHFSFLKRSGQTKNLKQILVFKNSYTLLNQLNLVGY